MFSAGDYDDCIGSIGFWSRKKKKSTEKKPKEKKTSRKANRNSAVREVKGKKNNKLENEIRRKNKRQTTFSPTSIFLWNFFVFSIFFSGFEDEWRNDSTLFFVVVVGTGNSVKTRYSRYRLSCRLFSLLFFLPSLPSFLFDVCSERGRRRVLEVSSYRVYRVFFYITLLALFLFLFEKEHDEEEVETVSFG